MKKSKLVFSARGAQVECDNCGWQGLEEETNSIPSHGILERLSPGCPTPRGECPEDDCGGAFCYYIDPHLRGDGELNAMPFADDESEEEDEPEEEETPNFSCGQHHDHTSPATAANCKAIRDEV